jgi:uncharacterized membrane protein
LKIKILSGLLIVDILTILLVVAILFIPSNWARIVLGLPFLLFFPGYALMSALFIRNSAADNIGKIALSCGTSIAIVGLIGFGLNFTGGGVSLEPALLAIGSFIVAVSTIALIRRAVVLGKSSLAMEWTLKISPWESSKLSKTVSVFLIVAVLGSIGFLGYNVSSAKTVEKYTEFYVLGENGKAENYPTEFLINQGQIIGVSYDGGKTILNNSQGVVTLGIVNQEQERVAYAIDVTLGGQPIQINYEGNNSNRIGPIELAPGQKWEQEVGFAPQHSGDNQKLEFLLFKGSGPSPGSSASPADSLHLWINVKQSR